MAVTEAGLIIAAIISAVASATSAIATNVKSSKEAEKNRAFQERMSSTAHQREVADLRLAGINPILSYANTGATTPGGSTAQFDSPFKDGMSSAMSIAQRKTERAKAKQDIEVGKEQINSLKASAENSSASALREKSQVDVNAALQKKINQEAKESSARQSKIQWEAQKTRLDFIKDKWIYSGKKGKVIRHLEKLKDVVPGVRIK